MRYAMSDIHGCYHEFLQMLSLIHFSDNDELYIIGDIVDRGPDPLSVLYYVMEHKNIHLIKGNHEQMMLATISNGKRLFPPTQNKSLWYYNGGMATYENYRKLSKEEKEEIIEFLKSLPLTMEIKTDIHDYILVHGGPNITFEDDWKEGNVSEDVLWERFEYLSSMAPEIIPGKIIVVGHTPTSSYGGHADCKAISIGDKRLIDGGCVFGGKLICFCLDTEEFYYVDSEQERI